MLNKYCKIERESKLQNGETQKVIMLNTNCLSVKKKIKTKKIIPVKWYSFGSENIY
jgi:hypothetical protein